jgi:hypothetical protein
VGDDVSEPSTPAELDGVADTDTDCASDTAALVDIDADGDGSGDCVTESDGDGVSARNDMGRPRQLGIVMSRRNRNSTAQRRRRRNGPHHDAAPGRKRRARRRPQGRSSSCGDQRTPTDGSAARWRRGSHAALRRGRLTTPTRRHYHCMPRHSPWAMATAAAAARSTRSRRIRIMGVSRVFSQVWPVPLRALQFVSLASALHACCFSVLSQVAFASLLCGSPTPDQRARCVALLCGLPV